MNWITLNRIKILLHTTQWRIFRSPGKRPPDLEDEKGACTGWIWVMK